jgi:hypothetical protein
MYGADKACVDFFYIREPSSEARSQSKNKIFGMRNFLAQ